MKWSLAALIACLPHPSPRSAFTMHMEAGHSAVPEEGPKDLRCPLCLYHTKYKRNMIDHIVLHRGNLPNAALLACRGRVARVALSGCARKVSVVPWPWSLVPHLISRQEITVITTVTVNRIKTPSCREDFLHLEGGKGDGFCGEHFCRLPSVWDVYILSPLLSQPCNEGVSEKENGWLTTHSKMRRAMCCKQFFGGRPKG